MDLETAKRINGGMVNFQMAAMGVIDDFPDLSGYSLPELVEAAQVMRDHPGDKQPDGKTRHQMMCDDRLVSAIYTILHFPAESGDDLDPILTIGSKALVCVRMKEATSCTT